MQVGPGPSRGVSLEEGGGAAGGGGDKGEAGGCTLQMEAGASKAGDDETDSHQKACTPSAPRFLPQRDLF